MRLDINLATRPYRDVRQFLLTWGTATALLAILSIALCWFAIYSWRQARDMNGQISHVRGQIETLDRGRAAAIALLNQPQNREVANESAFLNGLLARRSFSWTRLFMELERILPPRLHVVSISPSLNKKNQIEIHMMVAGDSREQAVELVKRLEDSSWFHQPELKSEAFSILPGTDRVQFEIVSLYVPPANVAETSEQPALEKESGGNPSVARQTPVKHSEQRGSPLPTGAGGVR